MLGRTRTVTAGLETDLSFAVYTVFCNGLPAVVYAPPAVVATEVNFCAAEAPHGCASTSTLSPTTCVESVPASTVGAPKTTISGFAASVSVACAAVTVIDPRNVFPLLLGSE
jgi:hypothetical protein